MMSWQYIAGFFDGEGNIDPRTGRLTIVQKSKYPLEAIQKFLAQVDVPVTISHRTSQYKSRGLVYGVRNLHALRVSKRSDTLLVYKHLLPFLVAKKQVVEDYVRFQAWLPPQKSLPHRGAT